jgi:hypothetical protein
MIGACIYHGWRCGRSGADPGLFYSNYKKPLIYKNIIYKMEVYMNIFDTMKYLN